MKNSLGVYEGFFSIRYFKQKINMVKKYIDRNMPSVIDNLLWCFTNIEDYFVKHGIITIIIIGIILISLYPHKLFFITSCGVVGIICCLLNKSINVDKDKYFLTRNFNNVTDQLDDIIRECMTEYLVLNNYGGESYITSDQETKLRTEVAALVSSRISSNLINKLSTKYNESSVYQIIATRINMTVMQYVIQNNKQLDDGVINNNELNINTSSTIPFIVNQDK